LKGLKIIKYKNMENFTNPKAPTLTSTYDASISSSTSITLNTASTTINVSAIDKGIFMKWGATASSSAFDEFIPANQTRTFVILSTTVQFIEESATAKLIVIEK
jgi:hypothetical protein